MCDKEVVGFNIEPYEFYCEHSDTLYRRVLEPLGFKYEIDLSNCKDARYKVVVKKKNERKSTLYVKNLLILKDEVILIANNDGLYRSCMCKSLHEADGKVIATKLMK